MLASHAGTLVCVVCVRVHETTGDKESRTALAPNINALIVRWGLTSRGSSKATSTSEPPADQCQAINYNRLSAVEIIGLNGCSTFKPRRKKPLFFFPPPHLCSVLQIHSSDVSDLRGFPSIPALDRLQLSPNAAAQREK